MRANKRCNSVSVHGASSGSVSRCHCSHTQLATAHITASPDPSDGDCGRCLPRTNEVAGTREVTLWETPPTVSCNLQGPHLRRLPQPTAPLTPIVGRMCVLATLTTNVRGLSGCLPGVFSTRLQRLLQSSYRRSLCSSDHIVQSPEHTSTHSWSFAFSFRPRHASAQRATPSPRLRRPPGHVRGTRTSAHRYRCGGDTYVYLIACVFSAEFRLVCLLLPLRSPSQAARTFSPRNGHPSGSVLHGWRLGEISMSQAEAQEGKAPGWRVWDALQVRTFAYGPPGRRPEL